MQPAPATLLKFSKDGKVCFNPEDHSYHIGSNRLTGVTSFISNYHEKFNAPEQAKKYAKKHGLNADTVLAEWEEKGKRARTDGTNVHRVFENYIETGEISCNTAKEAVAVKFIIEMFRTGRLEPVECETIVYGDHLASMIDLIAKNERGEYFILDWKTSKEISRNGYGKQMFSPFHIHPDANYYHYSLQVSIYKQLCKDYPIKDAFIVHLNETDYSIIQALNIPAPKHLL